MLRPEYVLYELFIRASIIINLASRIFIMLLIILCILSIFAGYHDMALAHIHLESFPSHSLHPLPPPPPDPAPLRHLVSSPLPLPLPLILPPSEDCVF